MIKQEILSLIRKKINVASKNRSGWFGSIRSTQPDPSIGLAGSVFTGILADPVSEA